MNLIRYLEDKVMCQNVNEVNLKLTCTKIIKRFENERNDWLKKKQILREKIRVMQIELTQVRAIQRHNIIIEPNILLNTRNIIQLLWDVVHW